MLRGEVFLLKLAFPLSLFNIVILTKKLQLSIQSLLNLQAEKKKINTIKSTTYINFNI
ncbi:hypothetical protein THALO_290232 [Tenacibaculum halocynthiae]